MRTRNIVFLALVSSSLLGLLLLARLCFVHFFWSWSANGEWTQTLERTFPSGEKLVEEIHLLSGFPESTAKNRMLFIQWKNGERETLTTSTPDNVLRFPGINSINHSAFSKNGDFFVIAAGRKVFYRKATSSPNQWSSWTLMASPEIYGFIKQYLDIHSPKSFAPDTNEFAPTGAFRITCNHLGEEQPLTISPHGDMPYAYEIKAIRKQGRELVAVPFASNPFAPQALIFSQDGDFGSWKFDEPLTNLEIGDRSTHTESTP